MKNAKMILCIIVEEILKINTKSLFNFKFYWDFYRILCSQSNSSDCC